jgi:peptidoglycan hydrolase-like protein with peptidoglycan-binding domain
MRNRPTGRALYACAASAMLMLAAAPVAFAQFGATTLRKGSHGHDVRVLQSWLDKLGYTTTIDGSFGSGTLRSVRSFEKQEGIKVDGIVDSEEAKLLRNRLNGDSSGSGDNTGTGNTGSGSGDTGSGTGNTGGSGSTQPVSNNSPSTTNTPSTTPGAKARMSTDGHTALAPAGAPPEIVSVIQAANEITNTHYRYGGGHGSFDDTAFDCSGAISHALHGASLVTRPLDSTDFESWGTRGRGKWITVYANSGHAYMVVAGLRFDTSGSGEKGPRWRKQLRSSGGYRARHWQGL